MRTLNNDLNTMNLAMYNNFTKKLVSDVLINILDPYVGQSFSKIVIFMSSVKNQKWN